MKSLKFACQQHVFAKLSSFLIFYLTLHKLYNKKKKIKEMHEKFSFIRDLSFKQDNKLFAK